MVQMFHDGGIFMYFILACLVVGLAASIERIWTISAASIDGKALMIKIGNSLKTDGITKAIELCANTPGPVAAILRAGLLKAGRGVDRVDKAISDAGTLEMAFLERRIVWLSTVISLAPMLGFTGTVRGMYISFNAIKTFKDISPDIVAGGISVALLTTLFGLVVAIIIQVFHNYIISRIDRLVIDMEENSVALVDALIDEGLISAETHENK